jgi:hypothetical protein
MRTSSNADHRAIRQSAAHPSPVCGVRPHLVAFVKSLGPRTITLTLFTLSQRVRQHYDRAAADDRDLGGRALLDVCADLIPHASRSQLMIAIFASGIEVVCNERIRVEIDSYWQSPRAGL